MLKKGSKLYSITQFKCPKCHVGDLYPTTLLSFSKTFTMHDRCEACGQKYVIEPGFYWGAMYIAYMLSSGILLGGFGVLFFAFNTTIMQAFWIPLILLALLYGLIFRLARSIWINIYVHYDPNKPVNLKQVKGNGNG